MFSVALISFGCGSDETTSDGDKLTDSNADADDGTTGTGTDDSGDDQAMQCRASWEADLQETGVRCSTTSEGDCELSECSITGTREASQAYLECLEAAGLPPDETATTTPCRDACLDEVVTCLGEPDCVDRAGCETSTDFSGCLAAC